MPNKKYIVKLSKAERKQLRAMIHTGKHSAKKLLRARILLKADQGWSDINISNAFDLSIVTLERMRKQFVEMGFESFMAYKPTRKCFRKLDGKQEAQLITLACSEAPEGRANWSLRLLASEMVRLEYVDSISYQSINRTLKKTR